MEKQNPPLYKRPWGSYEVLLLDSTHQVKRITVLPGQRLSLQYHHRRSEHWMTVAGTAAVDCFAQDCAARPAPVRVPAGEHIFIPKGYVHRLANEGSEPLQIIEVQIGDYLGEDDIVRLEDDFGRA